MKFYLTSAYPFHAQKNFAATWLKDSASQDPFKQHEICKNPDEADVILFVEHHPPHDPYFFQVLQSSIYKKYKFKCYIYHDNDKVLPLLPGVFPSIEKSFFNPKITQPGPYIARLCINEEVKFYEKKPKNKYLFSFIGTSRTHPIRKEILKLKHEQCFIKDTFEKRSWELDPLQKIQFEKEYTKASLLSKFVLCPRGVGPSTYRLFETMEMGIAPVIISDEWVPMNGPNWDDFTIRIPERQIQIIPSILERKKLDAEEMGWKAREAWEKWFSKEVCFHYIAESCRELHEKKNYRSNFLWIRTYAQFIRPFHFRNFLRFKKNQLSKILKYS